MYGDTLTALILIFGALCSLLLLFFDIKRELREIKNNGVEYKQSISIPAETVQKITKLVLEELEKTKHQ